MPLRPDDAAVIPAERERRRTELLALLASSDVHCPMCRYNLRGSVGVQCPECGWVYDAAALRAQLAPPPPPPPIPRGVRYPLILLPLLSALTQVGEAVRSPGPRSILSAVVLGGAAVIALVWMGGRRAVWRGPRTLMWIVILCAVWIGTAALGRY